MYLNQKLTVAGAWPVIEPLVAPVLADFYKTIQAMPELAPMLARSSVATLTAAQTNHWRETFTHGIDDSYQKRLIRIGQAHARIGLPPSMFAQGYGILLQLFLFHARRRYRFAPLRLVNLFSVICEAMLSDLVLGTQHYQELLERQRRQAEESAADIVAQAIDRMRHLDAEVQSVAVAVEQMDASIADIASSVDRASVQAKEAGGHADAAVVSVNNLQAASEAISAFLDLITKIADETNLLALNAAIEAARAGDAGRGFAVVAEEVRKLANGTASGVGEVADKLAQVGAVVENLRRIIDNGHRSFSNVLEAADQIATAMHKQKNVTGEMGQRMNSMRNSVGRQMTDLTHLVVGAAAERQHAECCCRPFFLRKS